ncbi:MAG: hypothetical protein AAFP90_23315, partial [Planctomycetota bacterium]
MTDQAPSESHTPTARRDAEPNAIERLFGLLQVDQTLLYALVGRLWQVVSGPVTIALLIALLNREERGIYYTLPSIVGIQTLFEMGLSGVLVSAAARIYAGGLDTVEVAEGDAAKRDTAENDFDAETLNNRRARLRALVNQSRVWYAIIAVVFGCSAYAFGYFVFKKGSVPDGWHPVLMTMIPPAAIGFYYTPMLSLLEGVGRRQLAFAIRFWQMLLGSLVVWLVLCCGGTYWSIVAALWVQAACAAVGARWLFRIVDTRRQSSDTTSVAESDGYNWLREMLPLQWRQGLISLSRIAIGENRRLFEHAVVHRQSQARDSKTIHQATHESSPQRP